ncbi:hypothetical protein ACOMHN_054299 [Nucella lapillus]
MSGVTGSQKRPRHHASGCAKQVAGVKIRDPPGSLSGGVDVVCYSAHSSHLPLGDDCVVMETCWCRWRLGV